MNGMVRAIIASALPTLKSHMIPPAFQIAASSLAGAKQACPVHLDRDMGEIVSIIGLSGFCGRKTIGEAARCLYMKIGGWASICEVLLFLVWYSSRFTA